MKIPSETPIAEMHAWLSGRAINNLANAGFTLWGEVARANMTRFYQKFNGIQNFGNVTKKEIGELLGAQGLLPEFRTPESLWPFPLGRYLFFGAYFDIETGASGGLNDLIESSNCASSFERWSKIAEGDRWETYWFTDSRTGEDTSLPFPKPIRAGYKYILPTGA